MHSWRVPCDRRKECRYRTRRQRNLPAVVELNVELVLELITLEGLAEVSGAVVTRVVRGRPGDGLHEADAEKDLGKAERRDGPDTVNTIGDGAEWKRSIEGDGSRELDLGVVDDGSDDGNHGDTAVLTLDGTTALEGLRLRLEVSERVVNSEGLGDTDLQLVDSERGGGAALLGRSKGGGGCNKGGGDSELHVGICFCHSSGSQR